MSLHQAREWANARVGRVLAPAQTHTADCGIPAEPAQRTYWRIVRESLQEIYQKDPNLADRQVEIIRESSPGTQQKIYQTEPFTIATDLAGQGNRPPTAEE